MEPPATQVGTAARLLQLLPMLLCAAVGVPAGGQEAPFLDATEITGLDFVHFNGMTGRLYYAEVVGAGGALFDFDGDGDLDLYLVQGHLLGADRTLDDALIPWQREAPLRDRLFRNDLEIDAAGQRLMRWVDVTDASGVDATLYGMGAAVGDVDGDGDLDLYTLNWGSNQLWRNEGPSSGAESPRFIEVATRSGVDDPRWSVAATFSDLDADDRLDLFVVNYLEYSLALNRRCLTERGEPDYCLPSAYQPQADALLLGDGSGSFRDATPRLGRATQANGLGVVAADWTQDDRQDLYVANDLMANQHWVQPPRRSNSGQPEEQSWVDDALMLGTALNASGKAEASMGVDSADADGDGDLDLITAHFRRESNTFYRRGKDGFFRDDSDPSGLGPPSWGQTGFGVVFLDYDGDGMLDVAVANGAVTFVPGADRDRSAFPLDEPNQLYRNRGNGTFEDVSEVAGASFRGRGVSRALIRGDLDNDGRIDLIVTNNSGPARVLLNQSTRRSWLGLELLPDAQAMGARVELLGLPGTAPRQVRRVQRDGGYASAHDARVLFAPSDDSPQIVRIRWPNGLVEEFGDLAVDRYHRLSRGQGRPPLKAAGSGSR